MQIVPPPIASFEAYRQRREERTRETTPQPVAAPVDPRAFCVAAIRRDLAEDFDGPAAA